MSDEILTIPLMKTAWKYVAAAIIVTVILSLMVALDFRSSNVRSERTCSGIKVEFADQKGLDFVMEKDVRKYVDEVCGTCSGKRVEELDLAGIEAHVDGEEFTRCGNSFTVEVIPSAIHLFR